MQKEIVFFVNKNGIWKKEETGIASVEKMEELKILINTILNTINTILNATKNEIVSNVTIDDKDELYCPALNTTKGLINYEYSTEFLIQAYSKMRPDYMILGETRLQNEKDSVIFKLRKELGATKTQIEVVPLKSN